MVTTGLGGSMLSCTEGVVLERCTTGAIGVVVVVTAAEA